VNRLALAAALAALSGCAGTVRYSQNPIGKAQFVGVAICEDVGKARRTADTWLDGLLPYPVYFRTDYRQLKARPAFSISFRGTQAGGRTWTSGLHEGMGLTDKDEPLVVLVTDRRGRIRGFSSAIGGASGSQGDPTAELNGLVEDLLLNLDGAEVITQHGKPIGDGAIVGLGSTTLLGTDDAADFEFQTDLKQALVEEARRKQAKGVLRLRFMKLLGKPLPDWTVRDADGKKVSLRALAARRVTVIALFLADEGAPVGPQGGLSELKDVHRDFGEGLARPGPRWVENAKPDAR
jgi:hypothetical protein